MERSQGQLAICLGTFKISVGFSKCAFNSMLFNLILRTVQTQAKGHPSAGTNCGRAVSVRLDKARIQGELRADLLF